MFKSIPHGYDVKLKKPDSFSANYSCIPLNNSVNIDLHLDVLRAFYEGLKVLGQFTPNSLLFFT